jgi:hypothetical protein
MPIIQNVYCQSVKRLDDLAGAGMILFAIVSTLAVECIPVSIQWLPGALFFKVKQLEREADRSLPLVPKVKNAWSYLHSQYTSTN